MPLKAMCKIIVVFLLSISFLSACGKTFSEKITLTSRLKDGGRVICEVEVTVQNEEDLAFLRSRSNRIKQAFTLIIKEYKSDQLESKGHTIVTKISRRIISSTVRNPIKELKLTQFQLNPKT